MVGTASLAEVKPLSSAVECCLLVLAACTEVLCWVVLSLLANGEVGFEPKLVLVVGAQEEVELAGVAIAFVVDEDGVKSGDVIAGCSPAAQRYSAQQEGEYFVGLTLRMDVHVSAVDHQILQRNCLGPHSFDIVPAEVSGVDDCVSAEYLVWDGVVGEAEEGDELNGGLASD
jgi:hypothetical protein